MGNALWLVLATPEWYLSSILAPFVAGPLSIVPAIGVICLFLGLFLAIKARQTASLYYALPFIFSEAYVFFAGLYRGQLKGSSSSADWGFVGFQLVLIAILLYRVKEPRLPGALLSVFALTYALFAAFVGSMSLNDSWL